MNKDTTFFSSSRLVSVFLAAAGLFYVGAAAAAVGDITIVAGKLFYNQNVGDGRPATEAGLSGPTAIAFDADGNLYIGDTWSQVVRRVDATTGIIQTIAGTPYSYTFHDIDDLAVDSHGNVFVHEHREVKKVAAATGTISRVRDLYPSNGIGLDGQGNLYISEDFYSKVLRIDAVTGQETVVAGQHWQPCVNGTDCGDGGLATDALVTPYDVAVDHLGNLFISSVGERNIRRVDAQTGIIETILTEADLEPGAGGPHKLAVDDQGNVYFIATPYFPDTYNYRGIYKWEAASGQVSLVTSSQRTWYLRGAKNLAVHGNDLYVVSHGTYVVLKIEGVAGQANQPPLADAGADQMLECAGATTEVALDGSASSDPDGDALSYGWNDGFETLAGAVMTTSLPVGVHEVALTVADGKGGSATDTVVVTVQDTVAPALQVPETVTLLASGPLGADYALNAEAKDICGPAGVGQSPLLDHFPIGTTEVNVTAQDAVGNSATVVVKVSVGYQFDGFLPPLKEGGVYKLGRTLPVKFGLGYANGAIATDARPTLSLWQLSNQEVVGEPIVAPSSSGADQGDQFRYADGYYIYNLNTGYLSVGTYRLAVDLGDGTPVRTIDIAFK